MNITVGEALEVFPLNQGKLAAGKRGLNRMIRSVNVMDAPDIVNWLKYGEILLTTAFVFKGYPEATTDLIRRLNAGGCSALGIKLGRYWTEIPQELIREAEELDFPLIELPFEYAFSDMMRGLYTSSLGEEVKGLGQVLVKQNRLMRLALSQSGEQDVYEELSDLLGYPIAVISRSGHLLYNTTNWDEAFWRLRIPKHAAARWAGSQQERHFQVGLVQGEALYGYLMVAPQGISVAKEEDWLFVQAGELLARYMSRKKLQSESDREEWIKDLELYLAERIPLAVLLSSLDKHGIELPFEQYRCVITAIAQQDWDSFWDVHEKLEYSSELAVNKGVHIPLGKMIISIYPEKAEGISLGQRLTQIFEEQKADGRTVKPRFFVSSIKNQASQLKEAYQECLSTQHTVLQAELGGMVFYDEDIELYRLLQYIPEEELSRYSAKMLQPLGQSEEMIRTLELFLEYNGQINEVAKRLFVHRNTIAYRMERLNELLHIEFRNFNDILKLKLVFWYNNKLKSKAK